MRFILITALALLTVIGSVQADDNNLKYREMEVSLDSEIDTLSAIIGYNIGSQMAKDSLELQMDAFIVGFFNGMSADQSLLTDEQMQAFLTEFSRKMQQREQLRKIQQGEKNLEDGKKFLAENKKKEGVKELPSGIQYKVLKAGKGKRPSKESNVKAHYTGKLIDGTVFDSSEERGQPFETQVTRVIQGWQEALLNMCEGDRWILYVPGEFAYGQRGSGNLIGPNQLLIFEMELLEVLTNPAPEKKK